MRPLRLGLLGTGIAARKLYWPALAGMRDKVQIVACANRTRSKAEAFAANTGTPKVVADADALFALPEVEAVLISLPIDKQPRYILKALKAGKAVLSEKPLAPSVAAGRRLLEQARPFAKRGPVWMVAENFFFMPAAAWTEDLLARGALGDLRLVEIRQSGWTDESVPYFHTALCGRLCAGRGSAPGPPAPALFRNADGIARADRRLQPRAAPDRHGPGRHAFFQRGRGNMAQLLFKRGRRTPARPEGHTRLPGTVLGPCGPETPPWP
jgi:hypothetical protein